MYDIDPVTHTRTCRCGATVTVTGTTGPSRICDACADRLLAVIWGRRWPAMKAHLDGLGKFTYPGADLPARQNQRRRSRYSAQTGRR
jgi:hypothetical protein